MDIRQLEIFQAVAKHRSFTKAAREIRIAQPAVSIAIRKLEDELELQLFSRSEKKVFLTSEGEVLLQHARLLSDQFEATLSNMNDLRELKKGKVRIGMPAMMGAYFFPEVFRKFKKIYPFLNIQVHDEGTKIIQKRLLTGEIELGVVTMGETPENLDVQPFLRQEMLIFVPQDHRLAQRKKVKYQEIIKEDLITVKDGYFLREAINRMSQESQLKPNITFETNLMTLTRALVLDHYGIGICLEMVLKADKDLVGISFDPPVILDFGIAWKKNGYLSKANRVFVDFLLENSWNHFR